jgi:F-type H+-transporting ATPase subunit b
VHSAVLHLHGSLVHLISAAAEEPVSKDPGPIVPELKELYWSAGSFVVFALLMRFWIFPKLKKGMTARYEGIQNAHASADAERSAARAEVADYESQLAAIKAEAAHEVEAARNVLETERQAKLVEVNARLAEQRAAATAEADAERAAARDQIHAAVSDVAGLAGELATGRRPSSDVVTRVVSEVMAR